MGKSKHDRIAEEIAKKKGGEYNPNEGADVVTKREIIEVETDQDTLSDGIRQLQGYKKPRYLAVPNEIVSDAIEKTKNIKVGVMDEKGNIRKPAGKVKK